MQSMHQLKVNLKKGARQLRRGLIGQGERPTPRVPEEWCSRNLLPEREKEPACSAKRAEDSIIIFSFIISRQTVRLWQESGWQKVAQGSNLKGYIGGEGGPRLPYQPSSLRRARKPSLLASPWGKEGKGKDLWKAATGMETHNSQTDRQTPVSSFEPSPLGEIKLIGDMTKGSNHHPARPPQVVTAAWE